MADIKINKKMLTKGERVVIRENATGRIQEVWPVDAVEIMRLHEGYEIVSPETEVTQVEPATVPANGNQPAENSEAEKSDESSQGLSTDDAAQTDKPSEGVKTEDYAIPRSAPKHKGR